MNLGMTSERVSDHVLQSGQATEGRERINGQPRRILMIVENSVPGDPRVWNEATTLVAAGYKVTVISLRSKSDKRRETIGGIDVYRFRRITLFNKVLRPDASPLRKAAVALQTLVGYGFEHSYFTICSLALSFYICTKTRVDVIH